VKGTRSFAWGVMETGQPWEKKEKVSSEGEGLQGERGGIDSKPGACLPKN